MKSSSRYILLIGLFILVITLEHVVNLPLLSFTFAVFLFASFPVWWRNSIFILFAIILSSLYVLPFWLGLLLLFCLRLPVEFVSLDRKYEDTAVVVSILVCTVVVGWWTKYHITVQSSLFLFLSCLFFATIMMYVVRQKQPNRRLRASYG